MKRGHRSVAIVLYLIAMYVVASTAMLAVSVATAVNAIAADTLAGSINTPSQNVPLAIAQQTPVASEQDTPPATSPESPETNSGQLQVITGVYLNDIQQIDLAGHSFVADFYVWFRWRDADTNPSKSVEFMNRVDPADHQRDDLYDEAQKMPDGSYYSIVRLQGRFSSKFDLRDYPYNWQKLKIVFEDSEFGATRQVYVPDGAGLTINPDIQLPGLKVRSHRLFIQNNVYPTNFGDLNVAEQEAYSRAVVELVVSRPIPTVTLKTFLPLLLVVLCALLVFFIDPVHVEGRIGLAITALLTLVALQLTASAALPDVDYLMLIDRAYLASYVLILVVLLRVATTSWVGKDSYDALTVARHDKIWAMVLIIAYLTAVVLTAGPTLVAKLRVLFG